MKDVRRLRKSPEDCLEDLEELKEQLKQKKVEKTKEDTIDQIFKAHGRRGSPHESMVTSLKQQRNLPMSVSVDHVIECSQEVCDGEGESDKDRRRNDDDSEENTKVNLGDIKTLNGEISQPTNFLAHGPSRQNSN